MNDTTTPAEVVAAEAAVVEVTTPAGAPVDETNAVVAEPKAKKVKKAKEPKAPKEKKVKPAPVKLDLPKATRLTDVGDFNGVAGGKITAAFATLWTIAGLPGVWTHVLTVKEKVAADAARLQATLVEQEATVKARGATLEQVANPTIARMVVKGEGIAVFVRVPTLETAVKACLAACQVG